MVRGFRITGLGVRVSVRASPGSMRPPCLQPQEAEHPARPGGPDRARQASWALQGEQSLPGPRPAPSLNSWGTWRKGSAGGLSGQPPCLSASQDGGSLSFATLFSWTSSLHAPSPGKSRVHGQVQILIPGKQTGPPSTRGPSVVLSRVAPAPRHSSRPPGRPHPIPHPLPPPPPHRPRTSLPAAFSWPPLCYLHSAGATAAGRASEALLPKVGSLLLLLTMPCYFARRSLRNL